jgi:hypothetical protein
MHQTLVHPTIFKKKKPLWNLKAQTPTIILRLPDQKIKNQQEI